MQSTSPGDGELHVSAIVPGDCVEANSRREPPNWRRPTATKEQEKLESDLGTNLNLPLREQGVAGLCCSLEQAGRSIPRDSRILEHEAGRACAARNAVNGGRRVRCSNREHLGVYAGDVDVIEEVKRISANRKLPGLPDFELL